MSSGRRDTLWRLAATIVDDILNPLLLISLALFMSVGYILTHFISVNIDVWVAILVTSVLLPLCGLWWRAGRRWRRTRQNARQFSWRALLPLAPMLIFLPSVIVALTRQSADGIHHMDIYLVYVQQIFLGVAPPESIYLPGHAATHYWLFHALSSAIVRISPLDLYTAYNLVNALYFFASLYWVAHCLIALNLAESRTLELGFASIFVYGSVNLAAILVVLLKVITGSEASSLASLTLLPGADFRLYSVFPKMINASGMTPACLAFTASFYACLRILKGETDRLTLVILSAAVIITLGGMPIVAPFLVLPLFGGLTLAAWIMYRSRDDQSARAVSYLRWLTGGIDIFSLGLWLLLSFALALPLVKYGLEMSEHARRGSSFISVSEENIRMTLTAQLLLIPLFCANAAYAFRRRTVEQCFVLIAGLLGFGVVLSVALPQDNQYKYHYLLSMIVAVSALFALREHRQRRSNHWQRIGRALIFALFGLAFINAIYANVAATARILREDRSAQKSEIQIQPLNDKGRRLSAYAWIRDNTPLEAIVVLPHTYTRNASLYHQRLNYVRIGMSNMVENNPAFDKRVTEMHDFYDPTTSLETYKSVLQSMQRQLPGRPLYAVVNDSELSRDIMEARGAVLVFEHGSAGSHVYILNPH